METSPALSGFSSFPGGFPAGSFSEVVLVVSTEIPDGAVADGVSVSAGETGSSCFGLTTQLVNNKVTIRLRKRRGESAIGGRVRWRKSNTMLRSED